MIEGLKVTIPGAELRNLCESRAKFHDERARFYAQQKDALPDIDETVPNFTSNSKRPQDMMQERIASHQAEACELRFISAHVDLQETFLLGRDDLHKLGILNAPRGYY